MAKEMFALDLLCCGCSKLKEEKARTTKKEKKGKRKKQRKQPAKNQTNKQQKPTNLPTTTKKPTQKKKNKNKKRKTVDGKHQSARNGWADTPAVHPRTEGWVQPTTRNHQAAAVVVVVVGTGEQKPKQAVLCDVCVCVCVCGFDQTPNPEKRQQTNQARTTSNKKRKTRTRNKKNKNRTRRTEEEERKAEGERDKKQPFSPQPLAPPTIQTGQGKLARCQSVTMQKLLNQDNLHIDTRQSELCQTCPLPKKEIDKKKQRRRRRRRRKKTDKQASKQDNQHTTTFSNTARSFRQTQALEHARGMGQKGSKPGPPMPEGQAALFASSSSKRKGGRSGMVMTENKHYVSDPTLFDQMQQQPSSATSNHNTTSSSSSSNDGTEPVAPPMSRKDLTVAREVGHGRFGAVLEAEITCPQKYGAQNVLLVLHDLHRHVLRSITHRVQHLLVFPSSVW